MIVQECPCCGSSPEDRAEYRKKNKMVAVPNILDVQKTCPYCGTAKCVMCDMGDDVECAACSNDNGDD